MKKIKLLIITFLMFTFFEVCPKTILACGSGYYECCTASHSYCDCCKKSGGSGSGSGSGSGGSCCEVFGDPAICGQPCGGGGQEVRKWKLVYDDPPEMTAYPG
ncbi:hypothetical protein GYA49_03700, partial [Candidatus Beckwithbacteria bacterium]|nr:hypothetical protein [Candidatus Beckwithbacteria bacterium]